MDASHVIGAITEVFSWIGFGGAVVLALAAAIARLADGTWVPVRAFVLSDEGIVRWFGDAHRVGEAPLTDELRAAAGDADELDLYTRSDRPGTARIRQRSPLPRTLAWAALAFAVLGVACTATQLVMASLR